MNQKKQARTFSRFLKATKKTVPILLIFSFIFSPVFVAFAQSTVEISTLHVSGETNEGDDSNDGSAKKNFDLSLIPSLPVVATKSGIEIKDTDVSKDKVDGEVKTIPDKLLEKESEPLEGPSDERYKNEFQSNHLFNVDDPTGALKYKIPIIIPHGRKEMQPNLTLDYSSGNTKIDNYFGKGWEIPIPFIERVNKYGIGLLYASSTFRSSLSGELATTTIPGQYYALSDGGENLKYEFANNKWTVSDKSGLVYRFGTTTSARQDDPNDSSRVYKWMLEEVRDQDDNYVSYQYYKNGGQIYPYKIIYTGNGSTDGIFEIEFLRESRGDTPTVFYPDFAVSTSYRINEIQVKINGSWVRKYVISYTTADNGNTSLLNQITESGKDELGVTTTLAPYDFDYQTTQDSFMQSETMESPVPFRYNNIDFQVRVADINGDGLQDILKSYIGPELASTTVYINNGTEGWSADYDWNIPVWFAKNYSDLGVRVQDINGDGYADIVQSYDGGDTQVNASKVYLNNATTTGWTEDTSWVVPELFNYANYNLGVELVDINGDNLPDIVKSSANGQVENGERIYINTGHSWVRDTSWSNPETFLFNHVDVGVRLVDINGDNLVDILKSYDGTDNAGNKIYINDGGGWNLSSSTVPVTFKIQSNNTDLGVRFADMNGDGLTDLVQSYEAAGSNGYTDNAVYLNTGENSWTEDTSWTVPEEFAYQTYDLGVRLFDANGDNLPDIVKSLDAFVPSGQYNETITHLNKGKVSDLLGSITNPFGGTTTVSYLASAQHEDSGLLNLDLPYVLQTVAAVGYNDGVNGTATTTYEYIGGDLYYSNPHDNRVAGFNQIKKVDPAGNITKTYFHQGNGTATSTGEYDDHISKMGKPYRIEQYDSNENLYAKTINKWDRADLGNGASFVKLASSVDFAYDGDSDHKEKATGFVYDDARGNLIQKTEYGEVSGNNDGTFTDSGSDKFVTSIVYASSSPSSHRIYLPSQETTVNQSSAKVRETKTYYDALPHGYITKGNPTKQEHWVSGSTYIDTEKTYNSYGLITEEKDPRDKVTTYSYDSYNLYPATTTNPLNQKTVVQYDYSSGKPKQVTDSNGFVFQTVFDGLDRVKEQKQPDLSSPSTLVTKTTYTYTDTGSLPRQIHKTDHLSAATSTDSYMYVDGFGRVVQERMEAEDTNTFAVKDTKYNSIGKVLKESLPYFSTGSSATTATGTNSLSVNYEYDALGRVTSIENVLGETVNNYDDWKLTTTDANGEVKHLYKDAYENLVRVDEINAGNTYTTTYEYDGNKNLTKITDALGNIRNFAYDGVGRRVSAQDLHASADSTFGTWYYAYDAAGNLASSTDPKSQNVTYTYDDLNRPTAENYLGSAGTEVTYLYDTCVGGVGRLCVATSSAAVISQEYNALGGVKKETKKIAGMTYVTSQEYDRLGNALRITNPDNSVVSYVHNSAGQVEKVLWKEDGQAIPTAMVVDLDYAPTGQISYQKNANGTETTNAYDSTKLYRLVNKVTTVPTATTTVTARFYAGAGDGYVSYSGASTWGTAQLATTGTLVSTSSSVVAMGAALEDPAQTNHYGISRGFYPFNTSAIPSNAVITDAALNLYVSPTVLSNTDNDGDDFLSVIQTSQDSNSTLTTTDYNNISGVEGSNRVDFGTLTQSTYQTFTLNSTGKSWIKKSGATSQCGTATGWTCLGTREGHDIINSPISANTNNTALSNSSESTGTSTDPYLEVTYELPPGVAVFQNISYVYDAVGSITTLSEAATTSAKRTVAYQYDDLHRLTRASSTNATNNYLETYTYNAIGNITNKSDQGNYTYAGDSGSNYANPHAATAIGSANLTYDKNGNTLTFGPQTNSWDYKNYKTQTGNGVATSTATYDHTGERVRYTTNSATTTTYVSKFYETEGDGMKRYVYIGDQLAVTIEADPNDSIGGGIAGFDGGDEQSLGGGSIYVYTPHYIHSDHLSGSNVVTDQSGALEETMDYYPYGKIRVDESTTDFKEKHKFASTIFDESSGLNYMGARYENGSVGQFISQDPMFWKLSTEMLVDPQIQNSYSYARNNPLNKKDPNGESPRDAAKSSLKTSLTNLSKLVEGTVNAVFHPIDTVKNIPKIPGEIKNQLQQIQADLKSGDDALVSRGLTNGVWLIGSLVSPEMFSKGTGPNVAGISAQYGWRNPGTLIGHFDDHAAELGITTVEGYAARGESFLGEALQNKWPMRFDEANNTLRVATPDYNIFGSYDLSGKTRSLFAPDPGVHGKGTNEAYWHWQPSNINLNY